MPWLQLAAKQHCKLCVVAGAREVPPGLSKGQLAVMEDWVLDAAAMQSRPTASRDYLPV